MSIRARIFTVFVAALATGFGLLAYWVAGDLRFRYSESSEEVMVDTAHLLAAQLAVKWSEPEAERFAGLGEAMNRLALERFAAPIYSVTKTSSDIRVYVTGVGGLLLFDSRPGSKRGDDYADWIDVARTLNGRYGARTSNETSTDAHGVTNTVAVAYVAAPIVVNGQIVGVVSLGKPKVNIQRFIDNAQRKLLLGVSLAAAVAIAAALLLYLWVSRPLQSLVEYANDIGAGHPVRLPPLGDNEIGRVGEAIEKMRDALLDKEYVESYVQSLTHEVKSPLTAIRASAELLAGEMPAERRFGFVTTIEREVDRLDELADRLLELAALERADRLTATEPVALSGLLSGIAASSGALASSRGITLAASSAGRDIVQGDPLLLRQAIDNLLRNSLDFAPPGSTITLATEAGPGGVSVIVQDRGPGIPHFARERIFDRFYSLPRPESGRKSTGLGLNFVREVAQLHGGRIDIECPEEGGTLARLFVPWRPL